jgi:bifunctional DNA-binding transcriptional regulator/antitoxin component of YhaV-PrlF toxin-antitoxin module
MASTCSAVGGRGQLLVPNATRRSTHAQLPSDLLIDDRANERPGNIPPLLLRKQILVAQPEESLLRLRVGHGDDVGDLVVDEKEDERDSFDGLGEEEAEGGEGCGFGGVGVGYLGR